MGWDGIGLDGSLGLVEYRAPYGANKHFATRTTQAHMSNSKSKSANYL